MPIQNGQSIFDYVISTVTNGIVPDVTTAMFGLIALTLIWVGIQLLCVRLFGQSVSGYLDYKEYSSGRRKSEEYDRRYQNENDSSPMGPAAPKSSKKSDGVYF